MIESGLTRVGYVVKRYPRFSETFVVNEILAHEEAGLNIDQIASVTGCHRETAKSRLRYATRKLRSAIEEPQ